MAIKALTLEQHQQVVERLVKLASSVSSLPRHSAGIEYTSLMTCFLFHNLTCAKALRALSQSMGNDLFPSSAGYGLVRSLFETEVTAHYIAAEPRERSRRYIDFVNVLNKREMDACAKHRTSKNDSWREGMELTWKAHWAPREQEVNRRYAAVLAQFQKTDRKGRVSEFRNWSGKDIRTMAVEVDHEEAYDVFYSFLSSFAHADIHLADRFLKVGTQGPEWSMRADELDVGNVFRYAATFFTCFLDLVGAQFHTWQEHQTRACWDLDGA
jgi:hypothetical protein